MKTMSEGSFSDALPCPECPGDYFHGNFRVVNPVLNSRRVCFMKRAEGTMRLGRIGTSRYILWMRL